MSRTKRKVAWEYADSDLDTSRDTKKWYKPGRSWKSMKKRARRARAAQALREGREPERERREDEYDYV